MSIEPQKISAAACASFCVRSFTAAAWLCAGLLGAGLAHADGGDGPQRREPQAQQGPRPEAHQDSRQPDPRNSFEPRSHYEARAEEQRRAMQEAARNAEMNRRTGRLTPDERRDLRRQINEAGQDLYSLPPRR